MDTALATNEWKAFTSEYWHLEPLDLRYAPRGENGPTLTAIVYRGKRGRLVLPAYQPHLPLQFKSTATDALYRIERQWLETARFFVDDLIARGTQGELTFPPSMIDPRPFKWAHLRVTPLFTNLIDFPFSWPQADRVVRQQSNKAQKAGYTCSRTVKLDDVMACLSGSQDRKGFAYGMSLAGLELAHRILGAEALRLYVCHSASGEPATARVVLHRAGGRALDWMAGTRPDHLRSGATQFLMSFMMEDLHAAQSTGYNSCGADIEPVAYAKAMWGGRLVPQYSVQGYDWRSMRRLAGAYLRHRRKRAENAKRADSSNPGGSSAASAPETE